MPANVIVSQHPLVLHKLTLLRSIATEPPQFRALVRELTQLLFFEATKDLAVKPQVVQTPLGECQGHQIAQHIGLMPILRAGLGMTEAILNLMPSASVWHLGLYRDHQTHQPVTYYNKLPPQPNVELSFVLDPMLATGGSAVEAITILKKWGAKEIKFIGLIAAPEGVKALAEAHPDVLQILGTIDSHLNEQCYIVPGLGDAGDRQFATT
jgi:uracil phosphoribosyltransferase